MKINLRTIGNFCLILVIIGFFMPIACDANGFQIANGDMASSELSMALYGLFISAIVGLIIGALLLAKKNVPIFADWLIILVCMCCGLIPFFYNINDYGRYYQSGAYMILIGLIASFIFLLIASCMSDTGSSNANHSSGITKKCPFCANEIKREAIVCQYCGRDLPREEPIVQQLKEEIINNDGDNAEKIKIIVERENNVIYSALLLDIFIDKKQVLSIENGARVTSFVNNGPHSIYASLDYNTQSEIINFDTKNPEIMFKLSVLGVGKIKLEKQKEFV